jgi:hypothetical protein
LQLQPRRLNNRRLRILRDPKKESASFSWFTERTFGCCFCNQLCLG